MMNNFDAEDHVAKRGVVYSNRVFVGNLHTRMGEYDVFRLLRTYNFSPEDVKVIRDINGSSKGYSFVDFRSEEEANTLLDAGDKIFTREGRKLLIRPAVRVQKKEILYVTRCPTANYAKSDSTSPPPAPVPISQGEESPELTCSSTDDAVPSPTSPGAPMTSDQDGSRVAPADLLAVRRGVGALSLNINSDQERGDGLTGPQIWSPLSPSCFIASPYQLQAPSPVCSPFATVPQPTMFPTTTMSVQHVANPATPLQSPFPTTPLQQSPFETGPLPSPVMQPLIPVPAPFQTPSFHVAVGPYAGPGCHGPYVPVYPAPGVVWAEYSEQLNGQMPSLL